MQKRIDTLIDLFNKSSLKPSQKALSFKLLGEIVAQINYIEGKYQLRIKNDNKIKSDFIDYSDRACTVLELLGVTEMELMQLKFQNVVWIQKNIKFKTEISFSVLKNIFAQLMLFELCYEGREPKNLAEFKQFILEPLNIQEKDFENQLKKDIQIFARTGVKSELITVGWAKAIMNKVINNNI